MGQTPFAERKLWNIGGIAASVRLDARGLDHLGPLVGLGGDEFSEFGGCQRHRLNAKIDKSGLRLRISEGGGHRFAELVDDLDGVFLGAPTPYHPIAS